MFPEFQDFKESIRLLLLGQLDIDYSKEGLEAEGFIEDIKKTINDPNTEFGIKATAKLTLEWLSLLITGLVDTNEAQSEQALNLAEQFDINNVAHKLFVSLLDLKTIRNEFAKKFNINITQDLSTVIYPADSEEFPTGVTANDLEAIKLYLTDLVNLSPENVAIFTTKYTSDLDLPFLNTLIFTQQDTETLIERNKSLDTKRQKILEDLLAKQNAIGTVKPDANGFTELSEIIDKELMSEYKALALGDKDSVEAIKSKMISIVQNKFGKDAYVFPSDKDSGEYKTSLDALKISLSTCTSHSILSTILEDLKPIRKNIATIKAILYTNEFCSRTLVESIEIAKNAQQELDLDCLQIDRTLSKLLGSSVASLNEVMDNANSELQPFNDDEALLFALTAECESKLAATPFAQYTTRKDSLTKIFNGLFSNLVNHAEDEDQLEEIEEPSQSLILDFKNAVIASAIVKLLPDKAKKVGNKTVAFDCLSDNALTEEEIQKCFNQLPTKLSTIILNKEGRLGVCVDQVSTEIGMRHDELQKLIQTKVTSIQKMAERLPIGAARNKIIERMANMYEEIRNAETLKEMVKEMAPPIVTIKTTPSFEDFTLKCSSLTKALEGLITRVIYQANNEYDFEALDNTQPPLIVNLKSPVIANAIVQLLPTNATHLIFLTSQNNVGFNFSSVTEEQLAVFIKQLPAKISELIVDKSDQYGKSLEEVSRELNIKPEDLDTLVRAKVISIQKIAEKISSPTMKNKIIDRLVTLYDETRDATKLKEIIKVMGLGEIEVKQAPLNIERPAAFLNENEQTGTRALPSNTTPVIITPEPKPQLPPVPVANHDEDNNQEEPVEDNKAPQIILSKESIKAFYNAIDTMHAYGIKLERDGVPKGIIAIKLSTQLREMAESDIPAIKTQEDLTQFQTEFTKQLNSKNEDMQEHRFGWQKIVANIAIACTILGSLFILARLAYTGLTNGQPLFFFQKDKTTSEENILKVEEELAKLGKE